MNPQWQVLGMWSSVESSDEQVEIPAEETEPLEAPVAS